mmetsp:Transcript_7076/g.17702  ORF Transcript_7076/g.17702 Transcript_7076/m.17702 type:complete len:243 (+) Transcript_7076:91-819(+)
MHGLASTPHASDSALSFSIASLLPNVVRLTKIRPAGFVPQLKSICPCALVYVTFGRRTSAECRRHITVDRHLFAAEDVFDVLLRVAITFHIELSDESTPVVNIHKRRRPVKHVNSGTLAVAKRHMIAVTPEIVALAGNVAAWLLGRINARMWRQPHQIQARNENAAVILAISTLGLTDELVAAPQIHHDKSSISSQSVDGANPTPTNLQEGAPTPGVGPIIRKTFQVHFRLDMLRINCAWLI